MKKIVTVTDGILRFTSKFTGQQVNRSTRKIEDGKIGKLKEIIEYLLEYEDVDLCGYMNLLDFNKNAINLNINKDDKDMYNLAIKWVFGEAYFNDEFNGNRFKEIVEGWIPIKEIKENIIIGSSGSGKTTLLKKLIGAEKSDFLAITDGNTTIGKTQILIDDMAKSLECAIIFKSGHEIVERINIFLLEAVKIVLLNLNEVENLEKNIYEALIISKDSKWKLKSLIKIDDLRKKDIFLKLQNVSLEAWRKFKEKRIECKELKKSTYAKMLVNNEELIIEFENWIIDKKNPLIKNFKEIEESIYNIIKDNEKECIRGLMTKLKDGNEKVECKLDIIMDLKKVSINVNENSELLTSKEIQCLYIRMRYWDKEPDVKLRKQFFSILERITSIKEDEKTLFPLINEMRISGNFKEQNHNQGKIREKFIITDDIGLIHDISENMVLSSKMQKILDGANKILLAFNVGTVEAKLINSKILEYLIMIGAMPITKICFTKEDLIQGNKEEVIKGYLKNILKAIEESSKIRDLNVKFSIDNIYKNSYHLENMHLDLNLKELNELEEQYKKFKETSIGKLLGVEIEKIRTESKNREEIGRIIDYLNKEIDMNETEEEIEKIINNLENYLEMDVSKIIIEIIKLEENFSNDFLGEIEKSHWNTIKAFNNRIAQNYDNREWGKLMPEAILKQKLVMLIDDIINIDVISHFEKFDKVWINKYCDFIKRELSQIITEDVKKIVYTDMKENCWIPGIQMSGTGSAIRRKILIKREIKEKFNFEEYSNQYLLIQGIIIKNLMKNKKFKKLKVKFRIDK